MEPREWLSHWFVPAGKTDLDVINDLMRSGSYSFDVANAIVSAAFTAYCSSIPEH